MWAPILTKQYWQQALDIERLDRDMLRPAGQDLVRSRLPGVSLLILSVEASSKASPGKQPILAAITYGGKMRR